MRDSGVSLRSLAAAAGMHASSLCVILSGKRDPRIGTVEKIDAALDAMIQARR